MTPEQAISLAKVLQCQTVTMYYCRKRCAIGRRYCYEILNNVDLSPQNILIKLYLVHREAGEALGRMTSWKADVNDVFWNLDAENVDLALEALRIRFQ
ncbi:MAG: hypothetical protein ACOX1I_03945 [Dethiobacteria bacterium]|jgi:hypothetical protein